MCTLVFVHNICVKAGKIDIVGMGFVEIILMLKTLKAIFVHTKLMKH